MARIIQCTPDFRDGSWGVLRVALGDGSLAQRGCTCSALIGLFCSCWRRPRWCSAPARFMPRTGTCSTSRVSRTSRPPIVTYASLTDMLDDTNRTGVFDPTRGFGRNIVGSGSDGTAYWNVFNIEGESDQSAAYRHLCQPDRHVGRHQPHRRSTQPAASAATSSARVRTARRTGTCSTSRVSPDQSAALRHLCQLDRHAERHQPAFRRRTPAASAATSSARVRTARRTGTCSTSRVSRTSRPPSSPMPA